jgi:PIN domain nuclease of toxin-antitoxin system
MHALVTDTHPLLYYFCHGQKKLSKKAKKAFDSAVMQQASVIYIPSVVFWEISMLLEKNRLKLAAPFEEWVKAIGNHQQLIALPFDEESAIHCHRFSSHSDPFDRAIVAAALRLDLPLITNDSLLHQKQPCKLFWD